MSEERLVKRLLLSARNWLTWLLGKLLRFVNWLLNRKTKTPEITIKDLQLADVLLFSGVDWISEAIIFLTGGHVSHSAIVFSPERLAHQVRPHAQFAEMAKVFDNRDIYVMRRRRELDLNQLKDVLNAANKFIEEKQPFPMSTLYLLGLILVYRRFTPNDFAQKIITRVLCRVVEQIEEYIRLTKYPGKLPMVCSQFVFQCYKNGGVKLKIQDGVIPQHRVEDSTTSHTLVQQVMMKSADLRSLRPQGDLDDASISDDALAEQLLLSLRAEQPPEKSQLGIELIQQVHLLGDAVNRMTLPPASTDFEMSFSKLLASARRGLEMLNEQQALFVTPGDLLLHCPSLKVVGMIANKNKQSAQNQESPGRVAA